MRDQAEELRMLMLRSQNKLGKSIAVVSGKGGVGKSNFSMNFTTILSGIGKKVILIDMDIGMGNIHILLGESISYSFKDYLVGDKSIEEVMFDGPNNLKYISGGSGLSNILEWTEPVFNRLIAAFEYLQKSYDYIVFDMGAGATNQSLELLVSIDEIIVITTAEPTSITDAYSMMKYIYFKDPDKKMNVVCNRVFSEEEGLETSKRLKLAMSKFLSKEISILGFLPEDTVVRLAVKQQIPFSILFPESEVTKKLQRIVYNFTDTEMVQKKLPQKSDFIAKLKNIFSGRV